MVVVVVVVVVVRVCVHRADIETIGVASQDIAEAGGAYLAFALSTLGARTHEFDTRVVLLAGRSEINEHDVLEALQEMVCARATCC